MLEFLTALVEFVVEVLLENIIYPFFEIIGEFFFWLFSSKKAEDENES